MVCVTPFTSSPYILTCIQKLIIVVKKKQYRQINISLLFIKIKLFFKDNKLTLTNIKNANIKGIDAHLFKANALINPKNTKYAKTNLICTPFLLNFF